MPHQCTDCGRQFDDGSKEMLSGCPSCGGNKFQFLPSSAASEMDDGPSESAPEPSQPASGGAGVEHKVARTVGNAATAVRDLVGNSPDGDVEAGAPEPAVDDAPATADSAHETVESALSPSGEESHSRERAVNPGEQSGRSQRRTRSQPGSNGQESAKARMAETENSAQASARSEVVSPEDLPSRTDHSSDARWPSEQPGNASQGSTAGQAAEDSTDETETERPDLSELRAELNQQFESIKVLEPGQYELNLMELYDREEYIVALQEDGKYTVQVPERWQD